MAGGASIGSAARAIAPAAPQAATAAPVSGTRGRISATGPAQGVVACQGAVQDRQRTLVEDRASQASTPAAGAGVFVLKGVAVAPLGSSAADRQALQGQTAGGID